MGVDIDGKTFRDRVRGCWLGKNCGGTLGGPLEKAYAQEEPFDVWWYPKLVEGGAANDDLELQLVWLKALEEVGIGLTAADLAHYWLDHIGYNWDEYGLSKTNLRLGLEPPASGAYNNWFTDCMGCPIRSEIWACIAPGAPRVAVRYAYQDAICDHAGGEGVYGEFFNAAVQSAAFVESDPHRPIQIGQSYVPEGSVTARAVDAAVRARDDGLDWRQARRRVMDAAPHYNAQYAPVNIGFQVIGMLWGTDFGDALCKAVNCGYDTDCTGATLGATLGIVCGASGLPARWTEPLGERVTNSESWGGLCHVSDGPNPIATNLDDLAERVWRVARRVMAGLTGDQPLEADDAVRALWRRPVMGFSRPGTALTADVDYGEHPAVVPGCTRSVAVTLRNPHPDPQRVVCRLLAPKGWSVTPGEAVVESPAFGSATVAFELAVPGPACVQNSNRLTLQMETPGRPAPGGDWAVAVSLDNALPLASLDRTGVLYVRGFLWSPAERVCDLGITATCPVRLWVNGRLACNIPEGGLLRPSYQGGAPNHVEPTLLGGWNELLMRFERRPEAEPPAAYLVYSYGRPTMWAGAYDLGWTHFPWEARQGESRL